MDRRRFNGGNKNAGRKPKEEEIKLIEKLDENIDSSSVFKKLNELIDGGNMRAIEIYLGYRFGRPRERVEMNFEEEEPIIFILPKDYEEGNLN